MCRGIEVNNCFFRMLVGLLTVLSAFSVFAAAEIRLLLNDITGENWSAKEIELVIEYAAKKPSLTLAVGQLELASWPSPFRDLQLECRSVESTAGSLACQQNDAQMVVGQPGAEQVLKLKIGITVDWTSREITGSTLQIDTDRLDIDGIVDLLPVGAAQALSRQVSVSSGELAAGVEIVAQHGQLASVAGSVNLQNVSFSNPMGTQAGENLSAQVDFSTEFTGDDLAFRLTSQLTGGDLFVNPLFFSWAENPPSLTARGGWSAVEQRLVFSASYRHPQQFEMAGGAELSWLGDVVRLQSAFGWITAENLATSYQAYLQPWLVDTLAGDMLVAGELHGRFSYLHDRGVTSLGLRLNDVSLVDQRLRFAITGLSADLPWQGVNEPASGDMRWDAVELYRLPFGPGRSELHFNQAQLELEMSPVKLFNGGFSAGKVVVQGLGTERLIVTLGGELTPVSLPLLTAALGWPEMAGTLAATVPAIHYQQRRIALEGGLQLNVFDGELALSHLQIENLFGLVPRLSADLRADNLDLALLTQTFDFGNITGRINGHVDGLNLEAWQPVAFDGWLQTPEDDPGPHKISQRAIDSLSSIGGFSGALQSTVLKLFDNFNYRRLGIGCRLIRGVCQMRGIADYGPDGSNGYYIVQAGGFWPRINLVGYNRRVDWQVLLQRLAAATDVQEVEIR